MSNSKKCLEISRVIEPVEIPSFTFRDRYNNPWHFSGARVSRHIAEIDSCSYEDGEVLLHNTEKLLTLREHGALLMLALSAFGGTGDLSGVDQAAIAGAKEIFYLKLALSFRGSNPGCQKYYLWTGEWTSTVLFFDGTPKDGYIKANIHDRPVVVQQQDRIKYCLGNVHKAQIPAIQGLAEETKDGLLNPETGLPFKVSPEFGKPEFTSKIEDLIREYAKQHDENNPRIRLLLSRTKDDSYYGVDFCTHLITQEVTVPFNELNLKEIISLFRPGYFISHHNEQDSLPQGNPMVMMVGRDDALGNPHNICFASNNFPQCGISVRPVELYTCSANKSCRVPPPGFEPGASA